MSSYVLLSSRSSALMARLQPSWIRYLACQDLEQRPHTFIYGSHCTSLCLISQSRSQPMQQSSSIRRAQHGPMEHHPPPSLLVEFLNMNLLDYNSGLSLPCPPAATPVLGPRREFYPVPYDRRWKGSTANSISHATGTRITWVLRCCTVVCFPGTVKAGGLGYLAGCTAIFVCQLTPDDMQTEMRRRLQGANDEHAAARTLRTSARDGFYVAHPHAPQLTAHAT